MADPPSYPGAPRWVKISVAIAIVLILLIVIAIFTGIGGPHGPRRHLTSANLGPAVSGAIR